jgi:hypothetical protein
MLMILVYAIVGILIDLYLYRQTRRVVKGNPRKSWLMWFWKITTILFWILLIVAFVYPYRVLGLDIVPKMWLLLSAVSVLMFKAIITLFSLIGKLPTLWHKRNWKTGLYIGLPVALIVLFVTWWGAFVTRNQIEVERVDVVDATLPQGFNGYTIAQISDLHLGTWGSDTTTVANLVDSVNALKPDLILFTGDIVNRETSEVYPFEKTLSRLKATDGVISILGNHDYGCYINWETKADSVANMQKLFDVQKRMGWKLLLNEHCYVHRGNDSIAIIGVHNWGEKPFVSYGDLGAALKNGVDTKDTLDAYGKEFKILMTHNPKHWRHIVRNTSNVALSLAGHTHAMQCVLKVGGKKYSPAAFRYENWGGMYSFDTLTYKNLKLYVNIGAGTVGMPFRIASAYPEVTLFKLRK